MNQYRQNNFNESAIAKNITIANREKIDAKITWAVTVPVILACIYIAFRAIHG